MAKNQTNQETATAVMVDANKAFTSAEAKRKKLIEYYKNEEKVPIYLSPMYRPHFGNIMTVTICGISIRFRVDGSHQSVPKTFADEIERRRRHIDNTINKQKRGSEIVRNLERSPGDLQLF